jgi:RNA polymerase sigma-70 factor (ECF subfamily)
MSDIPNSTQESNEVTYSSDLPESEATELFVRLLAKHERKIYTYVLSLVPHWADAEEIIQETNVVLWREFSKFQVGTNFSAWAHKIAFHQVLAFRKKKKRERLQFSDEFIKAVAAEADNLEEQLEERTLLLNGCIQKLNPTHRDILLLRYQDQLNMEAISEQAGRSVGAVYRLLSRIRRSLHECVTKQVQLKAHV